MTAGEGPAVLFLHGFPDVWIGWRPVMGRLVDAGYSVIAPDLRGFGESEAAKGADQATAFDVMGDLIGLLDHLGVKRAAVVAHDWGAEVGWTIVRLRPDRFTAVAALSLPYAPRGDASLPQVLAKIASPDLYMLYFLEEGTAEKELEADPITFFAPGMIAVVLKSRPETDPAIDSPSRCGLRRNRPFVIPGELP